MNASARSSCGGTVAATPASNSAIEARVDWVPGGWRCSHPAASVIGATAVSGSGTVSVMPTILPEDTDRTARVIWVWNQRKHLSGNGFSPSRVAVL